MTLIELMVVVTIIGISLMAFAPSFARSFADRRCATATMELVRMGRRARSEAIGLQRAMLVHINYGRAPTQTARMRLLRGNVTRCDVEDWNARQNDCPANPELERTSSACMESADLSNSRWFHAPFAVTVAMWPANQTQQTTSPEDLVRGVAGGGSGTMAICYEPSGIVRWSAGALGLGMNFSTLNAGAAAGGGLLFAVGLWDRSENELSGVPRVVLYPLAGTPRRLR